MQQRCKDMYVKSLEILKIGVHLHHDSNNATNTLKTKKMKNLQTTTTGSLFNQTGILTHAGDYAGEFTYEADEILEKISDRRDEIYVSDGSSYGWSDIMFNEQTGEVYAVWANGELTAQSALLQYVELDEADCPKAFAEAKEKIAD